MSDTVKLIIEIPKKVFEARKKGEISPWVTVPILDAVQNGIPLDNDSDRAEAQAYFDGEAYGWEEGRKDLCDKISAEIKEVQNMTSNDKGYEEGWKEALRYSLLQLEKYKKEGAE